MKKIYFYIVNSTDRPNAKHVAQIINSNGEAEYLHPSLRNWHKKKENGRLKITHQSTPIQAFGIIYTSQEENMMTFKKVNKSHAHYKDGKIRRWQGEEEFTLEIKNQT